jgi:antirestriction protein ArdC
MNTYEIVTERIINLLEQGAIPWRRPWSAAGAPRNLVSKKDYRGINFFLLSATKYVSPCWLTLKQASELGGSVRKGEHGQIVIFWKVDQGTGPKNDADAENFDECEKSRRRFVLRFYRVWNVEQCELPQAVLDRLPKIDIHQHDPIEAAERIIANMPNPPEIEYGGTKAFYSTSADRIMLPPRRLFISAEEHFGTWAHEASHSTGHPKRLNRDSVAEAAPFGSPVYAGEELIAELSAAYLCAEAGISPAVIDNEAAYIKGWLSKLKSEKRLIVIAAAKAQKAADYILGRSRTE